ncbi:MAG: hypothetical protein JSS27_10300 [Planctomycetes bacterium]|nr:hypothetical protein [Planctomycetota bacterium]
MHAALLWLSLVVAAPEFEAVGASAPVRGEFVSLNNTEVVLRTAEGERKLPLATVTEIRAVPAVKPAEAEPVGVELAGGSLAMASQVTLADGKLSLITSGGRQLTMFARGAAWVRFAPIKESLLAQWNEAMQGRAKGDVLVVQKAAALDYLTGTVHAIDAETVQFENEGEKFPVKRAKVVGIGFAVPANPAPLAKPLCTVALVDGSRWQVATVKLDGEQLRLESTGGAQLEAKLDQVVSFRFASAFLSDEPIERWTFRSFVGLAGGDDATDARFHRPRLNESLSGGALFVGAKKYEKGVSLYGGTEVVFRLPAQGGGLQGLLALAPNSPAGARAEVTLLGDDRQLGRWELVGGSTVPVKVTLGSAQRVRLVATGADERTPQVYFLEPRLTK